MPPPFALPPPDPGFELLLSSQGVSQGLQISDGLQVFPRAYLAFGPTQVGVQWRNISSPSAEGVAALFVRHNRKIGQVRADFVARYRVRTGARPGQGASSWEFSASARKSFGAMEVQAGAEFSPADFGGGRSLFVELSPGWSIDGETRLSAAVGRRFRRNGPDYTALSLGVSRRVHPKLTLEGRYYTTDRANAGPRYRDRLVALARLTI